MFNDINDVPSSIGTMLNDVLDRQLPLKSKRVKKPIQPVWKTKEILHSMKTRDKLLKKARNSNLHEEWAQYTHAKGQTTTLIKKEVFFARKLTRTKETRRVFGRP